MVGDSLREAIDRGLATSRFGIVVISPSFFEKRWTQRELNGLVAREMAEDRHLILPIWHNVDHKEVLQYSPPLADLLALSSASGLKRVTADLLKKIQPDESPLIVARDFLIDKGVPPPVVTDEWWLDIVETKEAEFLYPNLNHGWRWIFPLPYPQGYRGKKRGLNIAWTALQLDWAEDGKERKICQLSHPEIVHDFLRKWPGLFECAHNNPAILALYAPQLTIPGFDNGFEDVFDALLLAENIKSGNALRYGRADTIDGNEPLCGDFIAWRHPTYGNYTYSELSHVFVHGHDSAYSRLVYNGFECLVWLLSEASSWLPKQLCIALIRGMYDGAHWWITDFWRYDDTDTLCNAMCDGSIETFTYTKTIKEILFSMCAKALHELGIEGQPEQLVKLFIEYDFVKGHYEQQERFERARKSKA